MSESYLLLDCFGLKLIILFKLNLQRKLFEIELQDLKTRENIYETNFNLVKVIHYLVI